jgi:hypothetical protein
METTKTTVNISAYCEMRCDRLIVRRYAADCVYYVKNVRRARISTTETWAVVVASEASNVDGREKKYGVQYSIIFMMKRKHALNRRPVSKLRPDLAVIYPLLLHTSCDCTTYYHTISSMLVLYKCSTKKLNLKYKHYLGWHHPVVYVLTCKLRGRG